MPSRHEDDPYQVLGVARDADQAAIRKAYRRLAKTYHPDMNPGDTAAEDMFKKVSRAYDILGDAEKRARYDRGEIAADGTIRAGYGGGPQWDQGFGGRQGFGGQGSGPTGFRWRTTSAGGPRMGPETDFSDIFAEVFGAQRPGAGFGFGFDQPPARGADLHGRLTITFEEAALGARKRLRLGDSTLDVTIPGGVENGQTLRLKGKGQPGPAGTPPGDALIDITIAPHPRFHRVGLDVHVDVPVALADAVLGGKITVPTPGGPVTATVPANSSSDRKLRLKGRGIRTARRSGDLYARLLITLPEPPDPALGEAIRKWAGRKT